MHYRNGKEAKNGDVVLQMDPGSGKIVALGVLYNAQPGNDYCNGSIAPIQQVKSYACLVDAIHIDDIMAMLAEKGLDKRPAGK